MQERIIIGGLVMIFYFWIASGVIAGCLWDRVCVLPFKDIHWKFAYFGPFTWSKKIRKKICPECFG